MRRGSQFIRGLLVSEEGVSGFYRYSNGVHILPIPNASNGRYGEQHNRTNQRILPHSNNNHVVLLQLRRKMDDRECD